MFETPCGLDRQMSHLQPTPSPHGLNALVLVGSFLAGMDGPALSFLRADSQCKHLLFESDFLRP